MIASIGCTLQLADVYDRLVFPAEPLEDVLEETPYPSTVHRRAPCCPSHTCRSDTASGLLKR